MTFAQITAANVWSLTVNTVFLLWMSGILLGRIPRCGIRHAAGCILAGTCRILLTASSGAACYLAGVLRWKYGIGMIAWQYFVIAGSLLFLKILYRRSFRDCFLCAVMVEILCTYGQLLSELYIQLYGKNFYNIAVAEDRREYLFWMMVVSPVCLLLCGFGIDRSGMGKTYRKWLEQEKVHKGIFLLLVFFPMVYDLLEPVIYGKELKAAVLLIPLSLLLVIHLICVYVGRDWRQKEYILAQQASLRQQTIYIEKMERMQSELRRFRHDFQNMMAGIYLQAKEGDLEAVQNFIQEMTGDFDRQVGGQIQLMNQLENIRVMAAKSLLLEKLACMQQEGMSCELEVYNPFESCRMNGTDLCRCLGILVDNAMDEVRGQKGGRIHLLISVRNGCITFVIKNTLFGTVDFKQLGRAGYTTKGSGHGTGLESYRKILERYDSVFSFTAIQDGCFVQELKIKES